MLCQEAKAHAKALNNLKDKVSDLKAMLHDSI